jgi:hypothetical protein
VHGIFRGDEDVRRRRAAYYSLNIELLLRHEKGRIAIKRGDPAAAEAELREVVVGRTRILGERDPDTLASRHKLAKAMLEQTRWAESEADLASIVEDERHVRGYDHLDTIVVRHSLARAIYAQGKYEAAEKMLREIRAAQLRHAVPTHGRATWSAQRLDTSSFGAIADPGWSAGEGTLHLAA